MRMDTAYSTATHLVDLGHVFLIHFPKSYYTLQGENTPSIQSSLSNAGSGWKIEDIYVLDSELLMVYVQEEREDCAHEVKFCRVGHGPIINTLCVQREEPSERPEKASPLRPIAVPRTSRRGPECSMFFRDAFSGPEGHQFECHEGNSWNLLTFLLSLY